MDPYTRPYSAYIRSSPSGSNPDQTAPNYSYNRPITTYTDQKDYRGTGTSYTNPPSTYTEERRSIKRYSPPRGDTYDAAARPPRISKENEVLARANEVLQRSLKFSNAAVATLNGESDINAQKKSYAFTASSTANNPPVSSQNANAKSLEVLNRANDILKRSTNYSREQAAQLADKTNFSKTFTAISRTDFTSKETIPSQSDVPSNPLESTIPKNKYGGNTVPERTNDPRSILSRVNEALQNSNQISASPGPYGIEGRVYQPSVPMRGDDRPPSEPQRSYESRSYQETVKKTQFGTPKKASEYRTPQDAVTYKNVRSSSGKKRNIKASEYASRAPQMLHDAYTDALRRSQELIQRNEEELMRSDQKRNPKSSYVGRSPSPYRGNQEQERGAGVEDMAAPGIYLPAQGIKPKFVEEYYEDGSIYQGEKIRTAKHGRGEFLYVDGSKYEGEWEDDKKNGYGVQTFSNGNIQYDGEWKDDVFHGHGILMNGDAKEERNFNYNNFETLENNWIRYEGEFAGGKMHGLGTLVLFNNEKYVGKFKYDQVHGAGVFHKRTGETVSGEWENSKFARNL